MIRPKVKNGTLSKQYLNGKEHKKKLYFSFPAMSLTPGFVSSKDIAVSASFG